MNRRFSVSSGDSRFYGKLSESKYSVIYFFTESAFVQTGGKWLFDNGAFDEGVDLKTLLSRKKYDVLPE